MATTNRVLSSPAVGDGRVIVGSLDRKVYSYDSASGSVLWSRTLDWSVYGSPIIANGVIYVNGESSLYALNEENGAILWRAGVYTAFPASPAVADGIAFIGSADGNLHAFSVNGMAPAKRLAGGELGIKPALSSLKPDHSLKASRT